MRVISGTARGKRLREPADMRVRPTTDRVKESIFNIIQFDIEGRRVLDLFAGTGQLGIEAKSRGAEQVTFVDKSRESMKLVRENIKTAGFEGQVETVETDSLDFLKRCGKYGIIFLDPPYDTDLCDKALQIINEFDILIGNGIIVCETKLDKPMPEMSGPYCKLKEYKYGKIKITTYTRNVL